MNIVVCANGVESVRKIASYMTESAPIKRFLRNRDGSVRISGRAGTDINWATRFWAGNRVYNSGETILADKCEARHIMEEAGVRVSHHSGRIKWVARSHSNHYCGHGIKLCDTEAEAAAHAGAHGYYTPFFDKNREYRFHIGHGKLIACQRKAGDFETVDWNHGNGARFSTVEPDRVFRKLFNDSSLAVSSLGMSYGAVDIGAVVNSDNELVDWAVFEVNSSPQLEDITARKYARYFDWIASETPSPKWEFEKASRKSDIQIV